jgi:uncharacterized membrane protein YbhN (UPF0104 family)
MAWQPNVLWLLLSVLIVWASYAVLIEGWRGVVLSMGEFLSWPQAAKVTMVSNLGKYLPGKVWAIAGAALLAEREGVKPAAAVASAFILQALSLASGLVLIAVLAPEAMRSLPQGGSIALMVIAGLAVGGLLLFVVPGGLELVRRWLPGPLKTLQSVAPGPLLLGLLANVVGWAAYGVSFMLLVRGLLPDLAVSWATATAVFTASYLIGLVAAFAPGGIGPREFAFVLLLTPTVGAKAAVALAVASRLLLTITELGAALPFLRAVRHTTRTS